MNIKELNANISVSDQLLASDISELAIRGVRTIICNRPDGEGPDQPLFSEIAKAAEEHNIQCHYLPVITGKVSDDDATAFGKLLQQDGPIHAYCRSGMRSTTLWALNQAKQLPLADIVATAKEAQQIK